MQVRLEKYEAKPAFPVTPFAAFVQGGEEGLFMRSEPPAGLFSFASNGTFFSVRLLFKGEIRLISGNELNPFD